MNKTQKRKKVDDAFLNGFRDVHLPGKTNFSPDLNIRRTLREETKQKGVALFSCSLDVYWVKPHCSNDKTYPDYNKRQVAVTVLMSRLMIIHSER